MDLFFSSWEKILRIVVLGVCGYIVLVLLLRTTGQRTLSKLNAFDFVITVALGSTFGTLLLSSDTQLIDGIMAFGVLVGLQFSVSWLTVRSDTVKRVVKNEPKLVYYKGNYLIGNMKKVRIVKEEIEQSIRSTGHSSVRDVDAVVLETDGGLSIISKGSNESIEVLNIEKPKKSSK
ncbi:DUF421 domain-containing protein [Methanolobus halotolerans]|uniref:DUF421 domain-containing protein n=1 Tax=Methanolobus halotolerans TaxID=2052935 RepID=A0A4E0QRT6_9EURY|nr:DUF421 domain-containing protein [Methanolobus halotolerans]